MCILLCLVVSISFVTIKKVSADSGWDTSYDSGSSWSSSSSWDSGSSSSWSSSGSSSFSSSLTSEERSVFVYAILVVIIMPIIFYVIANIIERKKHKKEIDDSTDKRFTDLELMVYNKFVAIQQDWMNFNYEGLRNNLTDELYNQYEMQLNSLEVKGEKNTMDEFRLLDCRVSTPRLINDIETINAFITVSFVDYIADHNGAVLRGSKYTTNYMTYDLTFIKKKGDKIITNCPKCGAEIEEYTSNKCSYCRATIIKDNSSWVMSNKKLIKQR